MIQRLLHESCARLRRGHTGRGRASPESTIGREKIRVHEQTTANIKAGRTQPIVIRIGDVM